MPGCTGRVGVTRPVRLPCLKDEGYSLGQRWAAASDGT
jgi:hypothetical protein